MKLRFLVMGLMLGALLGGVGSLGIHAQTPSASGNVTGWAWGGSTDQSLVMGTAAQLPFNSPLRATGFGWVSLGSGNTSQGGVPQYGLNVPSGDGAVTGYVWSSNVGWINFQPSGPFPCGAPCPQSGVRRESNRLVGWARIEGIRTSFLTSFTMPNGIVIPNNSGDWEGWIKFDPTYQGSVGGTSYTGVQIIPQTGSTAEDIRGYAWSNELGWIVFGGLASGNPVIGGGGIVTPPPPPPPPVCVPPQVLQNGVCVSSPPVCVPPQILQNGVCVAPPTGLTCSPSSQVVLRNDPANFTASGGTGNSYTWNAPNSTNLTGAGPTFTTTYTATGTYQVRVTSGGINAFCSVIVPFIFEVPP